MKEEELSRREIIEQLEGYRIIIPNPDDYTTEELKTMLKNEV